MDVTLAVTYHDPQGDLYQQIVRTLPTLTNIFGGLTVRASHTANERSLALFVSAGAAVEVQSLEQAAEGPKLGMARRAAVALALQLNDPFVFYCDCDRILHWADWYPEELARVAACVTDYDFTMLGRTNRAFDSHPHIQRDTEAIVNHVFQVVSGHAWDVAAGARGLSRRAAEAILAGCFDEQVSTDVSWPLFLKRAGGFSLGYMPAEGLEFETADRYGDDVTRAGSQAQWLARLDADPRQWAHRLDLARLEIEGMVPYVEKV
jgi:hypothetical protein